MPETSPGGVLCGTKEHAADKTPDPTPERTGSRPPVETTGSPHVGLLHRLTEAALSEDPADAVLGSMLASLARGTASDLACIIRVEGDEVVMTPHSTRTSRSDRHAVSAREEPLITQFVEDGRPVVCERAFEACSDEGFFRRVLRASAFVLLPIAGTENARRGLLLAWRGAAPGLGPEDLVTLESIANIMGSVLKRAALEENLEFERNTHRRYVRVVAGREVRMAELKRENTELKDLVMRIGQTAENPEGA